MTFFSKKKKNKKTKIVGLLNTLKRSKVFNRLHAAARILFGKPQAVLEFQAVLEALSRGVLPARSNPDSYHRLPPLVTYCETIIITQLLAESINC